MSSSPLRTTNWLRFVISISDGGRSVANTTSVELCVGPGRPVSVAHNSRVSLWRRMRFGPKGCRNGERLDPLVLPPGALVAAPVQLTVMQPANRNSELVAHLASHRPLLSKFEVVGIRRGSAADQTRLSGHKSQMVAVALAHRFADDSDGLGVDLSRR